MLRTAVPRLSFAVRAWVALWANSIRVSSRLSPRSVTSEASIRTFFVVGAVLHEDDHALAVGPSGMEATAASTVLKSPEPSAATVRSGLRAGAKAGVAGGSVAQPASRRGARKDEDGNSAWEVAWLDRFRTMGYGLSAQWAVRRGEMQDAGFHPKDATKLGPSP